MEHNETMDIESVQETTINSSDQQFSLLIPFVVVLGGILYKLVTNLYADSDPFWSVAVGRWIALHGTVPRVDMFSWTVAGKAWIAHEWLFCWLMYWLDQRLSYFGVDLMIFIVFLLLGYVMYALCRHLNASNLSVWVFAVGIWMIIFLMAQPRAFIFTYFFVAVLIYILHCKRHSKLVYIIPLIFILWINLHSSAILGLGILFVECLAGTFLYKDNKLWIVLILSALATLINPYGFDTWKYIYIHAFNPENKRITEWLAPDFNDRITLVVYFFFGVTGVFASFSKKLSKYTSDDIMIVLWFWGFFVYALTTERILAYMILFWMPLICAMPPKWFACRFNLKPMSLLIIFGLFSVYMLVCLPYLDLFRPFPQAFPREAAIYLKQHPKYQQRLFNDYLYGAMLMSYDIKVFIDARADVYIDNDVFKDYSSAVQLTSDYEKIFKTYHIQNVLIRNQSALSYALSHDTEWKVQYHDPLSILYTKQ